MIDIKAIREAAESTPNPWPMSLQPNTVLALCDEIERLQKEVERLQAAASDPQLLTSDERRAVGERILMHIKHGTEYVK